ncbi:MAG: PKD domain-containing protein [Myxococcales bacterium]|nr:PKD domain-containing protein [Myxococcales bacterium]
MTRLHLSIPFLMALALGLGCKRNASVDTNVTPTANAGEDQELEYDGSPVQVTLDASGSEDPDGKIEAYIWMSDDPDAVEHPENVEKPSVKLEMGWYSFTLWVRDDRGHTSDPDSVVIAVGVPIDQGPASVDAGDSADDDGGAAAAGGDVVCNGETCAPVVGATGELPACCDMDSGGGCGAQVSMTDPSDCEAINQPGDLDPSCPPAMSVIGTEVPGCCKPDGKCGVMSGTLSGCIERTDYPPAFLMDMMQLDAVDCGQ